MHNSHILQTDIIITLKNMEKKITKLLNFGKQYFNGAL